LKANTDNRPHNWKGNPRNLETTAIQTDDPPEIVLSTIDIDDSDEESYKMPSLYEDGYNSYSSVETALEQPTLQKRDYESDSSDEEYEAKINYNDDEKSIVSSVDIEHEEYELNSGWKWDEEYSMDDNNSCATGAMPKLCFLKCDDDDSSIDSYEGTEAYHELEAEQYTSSPVDEELLTEKTLASMAIPSDFKLLISLNL